MPNKQKIKYDESWSFNKSVALNFDEHVSQSVPFYKSFQKNIAEIATMFIRNNSTIYDLGCSSGNTIIEILKLNLNLNYKIFGIDTSPDMIKLAKEKIGKKKNIKFIKNNFFKIKLKKSDLIIASLITPFLTKKEKEKFFYLVSKSLNKGGGLIIIDKIKSSDVDFENLFIDMYHEFKMKNFSARNILKKRKSLRTAMTLNTIEQNYELIEKNKFSKKELFFKYLNFVGFVCVK